MYVSRGNYKLCTKDDNDDDDDDDDDDDKTINDNNIITVSQSGIDVKLAMYQPDVGTTRYITPFTQDRSGQVVVKRLRRTVGRVLQSDSVVYKVPLLLVERVTGLLWLRH